MNKHIGIPEHAELVFEGVRSRVYQWDQVMYDGSLSRFEKIRFMDGAFVLPILSDGRILLTLQEQPAREPFISLPGGGFDMPDEDPRECALRELREETGYMTDELVSWFTFVGTNNVSTSVHYFIAHDCVDSGVQSLDPGEKIQPYPVTFDEFLSLSSDPRFQKHHWNLLPLLYEARLDPVKKEELRKVIYML